MSAKTDYACPNCRRIRRREGDAESILARCSCSGMQPVLCPRVKWELAIWTFLDEPLADFLKVGVHNVREKRAELKLPHGTIGRRPHKRPARRVDASKIDPQKSVKENAAALGCTPQRIRQLQKELNQTTL